MGSPLSSARHPLYNLFFHYSSAFKCQKTLPQSSSNPAWQGYKNKCCSLFSTQVWCGLRNFSLFGCEGQSVCRLSQDTSHGVLVSQWCKLSCSWGKCAFCDQDFGVFTSVLSVKWLYGLVQLYSFHSLLWGVQIHLPAPDVALEKKKPDKWILEAKAERRKVCGWHIQDSVSLTKMFKVDIGECNNLLSTPRLCIDWEGMLST